MTSLFDVVIPTIGRPSLDALLNALAVQASELPGRVIVVDDRKGARAPLLAGRAPAELAPRLVVLAGRGAGPASARNVGWRASEAEWVAFLDDDVLVPADWASALRRDVETLEPPVAASQGRIEVPLPAHRRPTDWERNVAGLERGHWITADMAYRRRVLAEVGGFDERFPRAFREDAELALRVERAGYLLTVGRRRTVHPVRPADRWLSIRAQRGNADDALMSALHGSHWRRMPQAGGRRPRHIAITVAALATLTGLLAKRTSIAAVGGAGWLAGTAEFAWTRIKPGPRTFDEVATMVVTSVLIPPVATYHWVTGIARARRLLRAPGPPRGDANVEGVGASRRRDVESEASRSAPADDSAAEGYASSHRPANGHRTNGHRTNGRTTNGQATRRGPDLLPSAVLFDRDGTLVVDVPYNGDPDKVEPMPRAREAIERLRRAGIATAVVTNQSGIGRGLLTETEVDAVNARLEQILGPLGPFLICPHDPATSDCECRKPKPTLILQAVEILQTDPARVVYIGDIGSDVEAALAAGARAILVPTWRTRAEEVEAAPEVARDLLEAVERLLEADR